MSRLPRHNTHLKPPTVPLLLQVCSVLSRGRKNIPQLLLALNSSIGNGLLAPCKHKWLEARKLGLSLLGALNMHLVNFH